MRKYRYNRRIYKKPYRAGKKKPILCSRFLWLFLSFLIIFGALFYLFIFSSVFQIKKVRILGNLKVPASEIKNIALYQLNKNYLSRNIFLANLKKIDKVILNKFPQIAEIKLDREFPDSLLVRVEERKPVAIFSYEEDCFFIDKEGVVFERVSEIEPQILRIRNQTLTEKPEIGKRVVTKEELSKILKIEDKLENSFKIPVEDILIISDERINTKVKEGWEIYFNLAKNLDWQLTELRLLLKERIPPEKRRNLKYIDLRFKRIYIYPKLSKEPIKH